MALPVVLKPPKNYLSILHPALFTENQSYCDRHHRISITATYSRLEIILKTNPCGGVATLSKHKLNQQLAAAGTIVLLPNFLMLADAM